MSTNGSICPTFAVHYAAVTDMGMRRSNNQDSLVAIVTNDVGTWVARGHLMIVADGMGAHAAGELASKLAVDNIPHNYFKMHDLYPPAALRQAIRDANAVIHAKGQSSIGFHGMGTTCSCLALLPQGALVAHIGDSRVYRLRGQTLEQLTFDHSLVWEMAQAGRIAQEDVPAYIPKNVITRSLGPHSNVHVDLEGPYGALAGDVFLLCSDGLSGPVTDEELGAILQCLPPDEAADALVDLANLKGGPDNISVIVARVEGKSLPKLPPSDAMEDKPVASKQRLQTAPLWIAAAVGAFICGLAYFLGYEIWLGASVAAVALLVTFFAALAIGSKSENECPPIRPLGGPYGNGPYRKADCPPNGRVTESLGGIAKKLRDLPKTQPGEWTVDWEPFDQKRAQAAAAAEKGDYTTAIHDYSQAIREIMRQLREHRPTIDVDDPNTKAI